MSRTEGFTERVEAHRIVMYLAKRISTHGNHSTLICVEFGSDSYKVRRTAVWEEEPYSVVDKVGKILAATGIWFPTL